MRESRIELIGIFIDCFAAKPHLGPILQGGFVGLFPRKFEKARSDLMNSGVCLVGNFLPK